MDGVWSDRPVLKLNSHHVHVVSLLSRGSPIGGADSGGKILVQSHDPRYRPCSAELNVTKPLPALASLVAHRKATNRKNVPIVDVTSEEVDVIFRHKSLFVFTFSPCGT